ncbi:hypothetical protein [Pseudomonas mediterranea]|uniref:Uncharacterized protein n=1 Tax=Pseudomonas mediterranea TaxID=183795 RepID=A0AAX2DK02_9PSED|nr:hypothetical protein [Pseudomonas mediterranea]SDU76591.1 hypothetical protein SAMN05216476_5729 [Pseudomonas mediterranea]
MNQAQWLARPLPSSPTDPRHALGSQDMAMVDPFGSRSVFIDAIST